MVKDAGAREARRHIETIRREAGLDSGNASNRNVQNLQNALHTYVITVHSGVTIR